MRPGGVSSNFSIDKLFDLTIPGTYTVTTQCEYKRKEQKDYTTVLTSSTFSVKPPIDFQAMVSTNMQCTSALAVTEVKKTLLEYSKNKSIQLNICFANMPSTNTTTAKVISKSDKVLKSGWAERFYEVVVTDSQNKPVPLTRYGHSVLDAGAKGSSTSSQKITVPQGSEVSHPIWLNRIFDMTVPDDYQVWAKCTATNADGKTEEFVSEKIKITVQ